jgi:type VI secretion system protein ImpL
MLAKPEHADAGFLTPQLLDTMTPARPVNSPLTEGGWLDLRRRLVTFFSTHLGHRVGGTLLPPAIVADAALVASTRQTVISVIGLQNSTDAVYQRILDETRPKYPAVSLAALLGDSGSRGLFTTSATVPGEFTREAWEERISKAIDDAAKEHTVSGDWVLSDITAVDKPTSTLRAELRQRYFDDYARAWEQFLNTIRWQAGTNLSGTVDQLTLLSDPQRSPLAALMKAVVWQAGTGAATQSLSDSLIGKARALTGTDEKNPSKTAANVPDDPLASAFGPILRFAGSDASVGGKNGTQMATSDLSLPRYIERVSAMRLKLQQIVLAADPNATSRTAAQAVLQGRTSDIAESRDYGGRVAASFGQRWAGFGDLFQAPLNQTWQMVLRPAAASLNETWRTAILADWDRTFGGRYPFADSDNDASLPEMARFMRPDTGVIAQFIGSQLAGIVERQGDHWAPVQDTSHGSLSVDPAFLTAVNRLMRVSTVLFPAGDAQIRFDLRGVPTSGVNDVKVVFGGHEFQYFNQREEWVPFMWPDQSLDARSHVEWQTAEGGLRTAFDAQGRFGPVRLFEKAKVTQQDNARYLLTWAPDQSSAIALNVQLRSDSGAGPMEVLQLRHFKLPDRIFVVSTSQAQAGGVLSGPPPLPPAALEAGRRAAVSLPAGTVPEAN